jgi:hypothetical protein
MDNQGLKAKTSITRRRAIRFGPPLSVRFPEGDDAEGLGPVAMAARMRGLPVGAYVRDVAIKAAHHDLWYARTRSLAK